MSAMGRGAREAAVALRLGDAATRTRALQAMAAAIRAASPEILAANARDVAEAKASGMAPALLAAIHGFAAIEPRLLEVERVLGLARWQGMVKISLPSATPDILAGLRLGLTVSLILAVVCEMIAGLDGLGQWVLLAARAYKSADIFAGVALLGGIGVVANGTLSAVESRILRWRSIDLA